MRFKLILEVNRKAFGNILPINYQYEQSAAIYKILSRADKDYSTWLHNNGYQLENGKKFKLFTYSRFKIAKRKSLPNSDRLQILSDTVEWQLSFLPEKSTASFIQGMFMNQIFEVGDHTSKVQFIVRNVEVLPSPEFSDNMTFRTMSPMCIQYINSETKEKKYLSPDDKKAKFIIKWLERSVSFLLWESTKFLHGRLFFGYFRYTQISFDYYPSQFSKSKPSTWFHLYIQNSCS